jgi:tetratricopeptide (TPR) repeat protein
MTDSFDSPPADQSGSPGAAPEPGFAATPQPEPATATEPASAQSSPEAESEAHTVPSLAEVPPAPQYPPAPEQYGAPQWQPPYGYPGQPSGPYPGPYPGPNTQPRYDYQYGAQGSQPPYGQLAALGAQVPHRRQPPQWLKALARPFPFWVPLIAIFTSLAIFGALALAGRDWAQSALYVGLAAGAVFLVLATLTIVRSIGGMGSRENARRVTQYVSAGLALTLLLGMCGAALVLQTPLHRAQAASYEGQKQWQLALSEFKQAGETPPSSADLARIYDEWAEQSAAQAEYSTAIDTFSVVLKTYPNTKIQVARAKNGITATYVAWGKAALTTQDYQSAAQRLDTVLALDYCDSACKAEAGAADATAYFNLAEAALATQAYDVAVDKFHSLLTRFPTAPEATQARPDVAKSLLGLGQKQRTGVCSQAIPTYQELSTKFADTPEGQAATAELAQPQPVTGRFTKAIPGSAYAILAKGLHHSMSDAAFYQAIASPAPRVHVSGDGSFQFSPVAQGVWDLVWEDSNGYIFSYRQDTGKSYYQATVGPLCAFDFGPIDEDFR